MPAPALAAPDVPDEPIHVVVTPSQASYFAGETFSVTVTITNSRTPHPALPVPRSAPHLQTHKRASHSISSVPLSRPPTSPVSRTPLSHIPPPSAPPKHHQPSRRGWIGSRSSPPLDHPAPLPRRPTLPKSLSISTVPDDLHSHLKEVIKAKSPVHLLRQQDPSRSPTSPHVSSPLARSVSVPTNHPHARKQSVLDGQLQLQDLRPAPTLSPFTPTPNPSTSAFSLSLDPISEGAPPFPHIPHPVNPETPTHGVASHPPAPSSPLNPNITPAPKTKDSSHAYPPRPPQLPQGHHPTNLGPGHPPLPTYPAALRNTFSKPLDPDTELILYSYARLVGSVSITPVPGVPPTPNHARAIHHIRSSLLKHQGVGGGSLDIASASSPPPSGNLSPSAIPRRTVSHSHARSSSLSTGLLSLISPSASSPSVPSQPWVPGHRARTPSVFSALFSSATPATAAAPPIATSNSVNEEDWVDPDVPLPTFDVQPTMLVVDLRLAPGESRSYTYTLPLPDCLPPTFRGRSLRFSYQFLLGICRAGSSSPSSGSPNVTGPNNHSRVMKIPIRVYTNVKVGRSPSPYDLLWPIGLRKHDPRLTAKVVDGANATVVAAASSTRPRTSVVIGDGNGTNGGYLDLQWYARNLLSALPDPSEDLPNGRSTSDSVDNDDPTVPPISSMVWPDRRMLAEAQALELEEGTSPGGCREAIEILTRNPKKLSFDVHKDGVRVAVLTFTKAAYRLGETVLGVVELNEPSSRARVLKLSAFLEAHEALPGCMAAASSSRHLRRVHAEQHSSFVTSTLRTTFSLDIPPDSSPAFQVNAKGSSEVSQTSSSTSSLSTPWADSSPGGLEWKVRLCLLVSVGSAHTRTDSKGVGLKNMVRDGPRGDWGTSWRAGRTMAPMEWPDPRGLLAGSGGAAANGHAPGHHNRHDGGAGAGAGGSWMSFLASTLFGGAETPYHDGDESLDEDEEGDGLNDGLGSEEDWRDVRVEMVECEVPIRVWPGNTAYRASTVVFDI